MTRTWTYRRAAAFLALGASFALIAYLAGWGEDTDLHRRIGEGCVTIIVSTIIVYVGGATADDALRDFLARKDTQ